MSNVPNREWFEREKNRLKEEIREETQEAVSNMQILTQNVEHLNDVGRDIIHISSIWVKFLQERSTISNK